SQELENWIGGHVRALEYIQGVPEILVPDNLKSAVARACRYEPDLNPTYQEMAAHYGAAVIPARPRHPRDRAKVEVGVQVVERWILAALRHRVFFSLAELNQAIAEELVKLNEARFQKLEGSRRLLYETVEKAALKPLPPQRYEFAHWKKARVNVDYHVEVEGNYYSVPHRLIKEQVEVRYTAGTVEILYRGQRVASHRRSYGKGQYVTNPEHRPRSHREYLEWTPERLVLWAEKTGENTARLVQRLMETKPHPEQGYRSCLGIMRLGRCYGEERLEAACARALACGALSYQSIKSILKNGLDRLPLSQVPPVPPVGIHPNLRGASYYAGEEGEHA
ncbi:MAG: Mu transposase domain-containing protein, partial [Moorellales bacterium]